MALESRESVVRLNVKLLEKQQHCVKTREESPPKFQASKNGTPVDSKKNLAESLKEERKRIEARRLELEQKKNQLDQHQCKQEVFQLSQQTQPKLRGRPPLDATPPLGIKFTNSTASNNPSSSGYQSGLQSAAVVAAAAIIPHSIKSQAQNDAGDSIDSTDMKLSTLGMSLEERKRQEKNREASKQWRQRKKQQENEREQKLIQMRFVNESLKLANQMNVMRRDFLKQLIEQRDRLMAGLRTQSPAVSTASA